MNEASRHHYLVALGSNMRVPGVGPPRAVLRRAIDAMAKLGLEVTSVSTLIETAPVGPSMRRYANGAAVIETALAPPELLRIMQGIEQVFGRRRSGQRWRARPLDLDIVMWSGGIWVSPELAIPHPRFRERQFVLGPGAQVAPEWRDPISGLTLRQLSARAA